MTASAELTAAPAASDSRWFKFAIAVGLVGLADALLYNGRPIGLALPLFLGVLAATSIFVNVVMTSRARLIGAGVLVVAGLAPVIEDLSLLSFAVMLVMILSAVAFATDSYARGFWLPLSAARQLLLFGPFRLVPDMIMILREHSLTRALLIWGLPLTFGAVFAALFAAANPVIAQWLAILSADDSASELTMMRAIFWLLALTMIWPFVHLRWRQRIEPPQPAVEPSPGQPLSLLAIVLGPATVIRSLVLFNLLFALQTVLDGAYLWGHAALPGGVTYATYAHRGAYLLIVTALLAAAFVIVASRSENIESGSPLVRPLIYLWLAQNVMLVLSSIQRLHMYVETYALTYWRVAALVWMVLVAIGLVLIVFRIVLAKPVSWLIRMNLLMLSVTLYACTFVNLDAAIADYNVAHSREAGRSGPSIDSDYLVWLGPQALPALDRAMRLIPTDRRLGSSRDLLLRQQDIQMEAWRSWSFRGWRLQRYLDTHPLSSNPS
ncbi:conserved hypothetical protein; putative membrane protein [Bradyrhizobium sp. ORS 278]|uniref:DUF4153 domain-containing protein n=1 Tax=Bradyrhizobium sp. (strain ORS 278) TaxID=114615 RepID=UPI0001508E5D|nr:DUF4173 domain-containing protein [Bradyrhizobium sp. ORS 278]CAL77711.1 conserved hypothetical protein; putative membrane protein [Bradyrhizobium sp. ORS 278]